MKKYVLLLVLTTIAISSYGQGTIQFVNNTLQRFQISDGDSSQNIPANHPLNFGVFFGTSASTLSLTPVGPLATMSSVAGVITVANGNAYQLAGTQPNDVVFMQIRAWPSSFGSDWAAAWQAYVNAPSGPSGLMWGETPVIQIAALGASSGPGTVIWQGSTGTNPDRFTPLIIHVPVPEPSTIALAVLGMAGLTLIRCRK